MKLASLLHRSLALSTLVALALAGGCSKNGSADADASIDEGPPPVMELPDCEPAGGECTMPSDCCSNVCDEERGECRSGVSTCGDTGDACVEPGDCCSFHCGPDGQCREDACISDNQTCDETAGDFCCSGLCDDGTCTPLNTSCKTAGNSCDSGSECCSTLCLGGSCVLAASYCVQHGDACTTDGQCCSGLCTVAGGAVLGTCDQPPQAPANCSGVDGTVCSGCGECCSRLCAPFGTTGVFICQPASGCRVTGELCKQDSDCCGGEGSNTLGEGNVTCEKEGGAEIGRCRNPQSCNPQGNVCHFKDYECGNSTSSNNCCGDLNKKLDFCRLDGSGIPRCQLDADQCVMQGDICATAGDCCDGLPCVPDGDGVLRCSDQVCIPAGGACTSNGDCCPGNTCNIPPGESQGTCGDSGTECVEFGQICESDADCCNQVPCIESSDGLKRCLFIVN
jgi:hypothetical protein